MKSSEGERTKNIKEIIHAMVYFPCPECETVMVPDIGVAGPASGYPKKDKLTIIDLEGKECKLIYARLRCPSCDAVIPVSSFEI